MCNWLLLDAQLHKLKLAADSVTLASLYYAIASSYLEHPDRMLFTYRFWRMSADKIVLNCIK